MSCVKENDPESGEVESITLFQFPNTNQNGDYFDALGDGPDVYVTLDTGNTTVFTSDIYFNNAFSPGQFTFPMTSLIEFTDFNTEFWVNVYDYDSLDTDDYMSSMVFIPSEFPSAYPAAQLANQGDYEIQMDFFWKW